MLRTKTSISVLSVVFMLSCAVGGQAFAQTTTLKIGYVDLQQVIDASQGGKQARAEIQKKADELSQKAEDMKQELAALQQDYEQQALALSPEAKTQKRDQISKLERDYSRFVKDSKSELRVIEQRALQELYKEIEEIVVEFGQQQGFDAILERQVFLYASEAIDVTDQVIALYNSLQ